MAEEPQHLALECLRRIDRTLDVLMGAAAD